MEIDPMEYVKEEGAAQELLAEEKKDSKLNGWVAIAIALLSTFAAVCTVTERNIVKQMTYQQVQALDNWNFYQSRTIRGQLAQSVADDFTIRAIDATGAAKVAYLAKAKDYVKVSVEQSTKKNDQMDAAKAAEAKYEKLKQRDEQFDVSEAILAIAVSMLALTALTHKKWLFFAALIPTVIGIILGLLGLMHILVRIDHISRYLM